MHHVCDPGTLPYVRGSDCPGQDTEGCDRVYESQGRCAGSVLDLLHEDGFNHQVETEVGMLGEECSQMLKDFLPGAAGEEKRTKKRAAERARAGVIKRESKKRKQKAYVKQKTPFPAGWFTVWENGAFFVC